MFARVGFGVALLLACSSPEPQPQRPANPSCLAPPRPRSQIQLVRAFPELAFEQPVELVPTSDGAWWYVVERHGRIWRFANREAAAPELVLDLTPRIDTSGDDGLVALALHPAFATNGQIFVSYMQVGTTSPFEARVSRFVSSDGGASFDPSTEQTVLAIPQGLNVHANGALRFGPDGYLYAGFGDGSNPELGDADGHAQDTYSLHGKILRIDVDAGTPYAIPPDNPFCNGGGAPEVWAYGLRNPWRFSFDRETGELWAGDVGWAAWEEIDRIVPGGNYGWSVFEGPACLAPERCPDPALREPALYMFHDSARSIVVGHVYRGTANAALRGRLVFADFITGYIWAIDPQAPQPTPEVLEAGGRNLVSFAEDVAGELYVVDITSGTLWRLAPGDDPTAPPDVPSTLTATGCFDATGEPAAGLIPYNINWPFWSSGADKQRWLAIPDGARIGIDPDGNLSFPIGSVLVKQFALGDERLETRLLVRHDDGDWAGYTYAWRGDRSDADLVPLSASLTATPSSGGWWYLPRRTECLGCHTRAAGRTLGTQLAQLDRDTREALADFELFKVQLPGGPVVPHIADPETPLAERARAWLHANCANCHRPGSTGTGDMDLRYATTLPAMHICDRSPTRGALGIADARILAPGDPARSVLLARIRAEDSYRMPPVLTGFFTIDSEGAALVEAWIRTLPDCR